MAPSHSRALLGGSRDIARCACCLLGRRRAASIAASSSAAPTYLQWLRLSLVLCAPPPWFYAAGSHSLEYFSSIPIVQHHHSSTHTVMSRQRKRTPSYKPEVCLKLQQKQSKIAATDEEIEDLVIPATRLLAPEVPAVNANTRRPGVGPSADRR